MTIEEALTLLRCPELTSENKQYWADLGCGSGLFTVALARLLRPESIIYAVDNNKAALRTIPEHYNNVAIEKIQTDFMQDEWPFTNLDGILMANSLHYAKDKIILMDKTRKHMKQNHHFLIVEYDTNVSNRWIPFPLDFLSLQDLFAKAGYSAIRKLHEKKSVFHNFSMYSAIISR